MFLITIFLPLIGACIAGFGGRYLGKFGAIYIATIFSFYTLLLSFFIFFRYYTLAGTSFFFTVECFSWLTFGKFEILWEFIFDSLSVWMLFVVSLISFCVHLYSIAYMANDPHQPRFFAFLSLFTFFMLILITAGNFLQFFVGWEGVGLCSYLLIAFWYHRIAANKAALKAIFLNRIGDVAYIIALIFTGYLFETLNFELIKQKMFFSFSNSFIMYNFSIDFFMIICFFFFLGAIGKSAQIGLHTWLPDAMEGPTPVSALIHSATMVTAGVFLIIRSSFLFEYAENILLLISVVGAITCFFAASAGLLQNDIKKIIAYSTCSQLGYMVFACGLSAYHVSFFHLVNHAFFKALLFLCAGSIIHALYDEQDIRKMGGLVNLLPITYSAMLIGSLSLMGFPFLTGFYSKDFILELAFIKLSYSSLFSYWLGILTVFFTAYYSFRILFLVFFIVPQGYKAYFSNVHEVSWFMGIPLILLALGSIFFGFFFKDLFIGPGSPFFNDAIFILPKHGDIFILTEYEVSFFVKNIPFYFSILAIGIFYFIEKYFLKFFLWLKLSRYGRQFTIFFTKKWFFDLLYNEFFGITFLKACYFDIFQVIDKGFLEYFGPYGFNKIVYIISNYFVQLQSGKLSHYLSFFFFSTIFSFFFLEFLYLFF